jgi:hypothetical protein
MPFAVAHDTVWMVVFLMVILKIPIVYLCAVVYYAIRATPRPPEGAAVTADLDPNAGPGSGWRRLRPRRLGPHPHGGPTRTYPRTPRTAHAHAEADRR